MRYALIDGSRIEAETGLKGFCPGCGQPVIAKCGTIKVRHWAHQRTEMCDKWWETEEEWHRSWKNQFPSLWQEYFLRDPLTGEKHLADIRTDHGLVIEFQHSHIRPEERIAREVFYKDLVWVVDGTRLKYDYPRFEKGQYLIQASSQQNISYVYDLKRCFPAAWLNSSVPVVFDFLGSDPVEDPSGLKDMLYCIFPVKVGRRATLAKISRNAFIKAVMNGEWSARVRRILRELLKEKQEWENQQIQSNDAWQMHSLQMSVLNNEQKYGKH